MNDRLKSKDVLRIDELLQSKGISKTDFADRLGVNRQTLYSFLNRNITLETIIKIAEALDVQVWELFSDPSEPHQNDLDGFVEYRGTIYRISTVDDLESLLKLVKNEN